MFKVEIRTTCKTCDAPITKKRWRRFCSAKCRNKFYNKKRYESQAKWQRDKNDAIASVASPHKLQCKICGRWYVQVGSHIYWRHRMLARDYRKEYGFDVKKGQLPGWYRKIKGGQVFENGTIKNLEVGKKYWFKEGQPGVGIYERSPETMARLHNLRKLTLINK
jgi:predicted nucleic acid-binding Zn ribbon protein